MDVHRRSVPPDRPSPVSHPPVGDDLPVVGKLLKYRWQYLRRVRHSRDELYGRRIEKSVGSAPTLGDYWTEYATATGATPTNVLGDATQSVKGRAGWAGFVVGGVKTAAGASTQTATVAINFDENFLFGGAYFLSKDAPYLTNVSTLQWAVGFSTNLSKCLSMASGQTGINTAATSVPPGAGGLFTNLNILVDSYDQSPFMKLPAKAYYPIDRYDFQTSSVAYTVAAGATQVGMTSPVISALPFLLACISSQNPPSPPRPSRTATSWHRCLLCR